MNDLTGTLVYWVSRDGHNVGVVTGPDTRAPQWDLWLVEFIEGPVSVMKGGCVTRHWVEVCAGRGLTAAIRKG